MPQFSRLRQQFGWKTYSSEFGLIAFGGRHFKYLDILGGPQLDFTNANEVERFKKYISNLGRETGAVYVKCMPDVVYQLRENDGTPIPDSQNADVIPHLNQFGFKHQGFSANCSGQPRLIYVRNLVEDSYELELKHFKGTVRTELRKAKDYGLEVQRVTHAEQLQNFKLALEETGQRQGFADKSISYYKAVLNSFEDKAHFMTVVLNPNAAIGRTNQRIGELEHQLETSNKSIGQQTELQNQLNAAKKRLTRLEQLPQTDAITICSGLFIETGTELVYLFGGTRTDYLDFSGVYLLQEVMMQYCFEQGIRRYNFYGVSDQFDKNNPNYGVLAFKQSYRGEIIELVGEFIMPIKRLQYGIYTVIRKILNRN
jgi:alanine adding enzyme